MPHKDGPRSRPLPDGAMSSVVIVRQPNNGLVARSSGREWNCGQKPVFPDAKRSQVHRRWWRGEVCKPLCRRLAARHRIAHRGMPSYHRTFPEAVGKVGRGTELDNGATESGTQVTVLEFDLTHQDSLSETDTVSVCSEIHRREDAPKNRRLRLVWNNESIPQWHHRKVLERLVLELAGRIGCVLWMHHCKLQMRLCVCHRVGPFWVHFGSIL